MKYFKIILLLIFTPIPLTYGQTEVVNKVAAIVNDEVITQQDINQLLSVLYAQYVHEYKGDELLRKMEEVRRDILKQMIEDKLILSRAKELDIKVTNQEINERLEEIKSGFPSEKDFYDTLEAQGITVANLKDRYRDQAMMKKIVDIEVKSKIFVLPSEVIAYYENNRDLFKQGEKYRVRHILIKADDEVSRELAKVEIKEIYNRLAVGEDFAELAKAYSQGPNKENGGDMGYIGKGEMLEELDEVIFNLKPGEFSHYVESKLGCHLFKVEDVSHSGYVRFEDVQTKIKQFLFQKKLQDKLDEWALELGKTAYISIK